MTNGAFISERPSAKKKSSWTAKARFAHLTMKSNAKGLPFDVMLYPTISLISLCSESWKTGAHARSDGDAPNSVANPPSTLAKATKSPGASVASIRF